MVGLSATGLLSVFSEFHGTLIILKHDIVLNIIPLYFWEVMSPQDHLTENYAKHTLQPPCSCFKSGLTKDLWLLKTTYVSID